MTAQGQRACSNDNCQFFNNCFFATISSWSKEAMPEIVALANNVMGCRKYKLKEAVMDKVIRAKVEEFVGKQLMFTSVDISNAIKRDGTWVRNSEVSSWLHRNFNDVNDSRGADYIQAQVSVLNNTVTALLYLHVTHNVDSYTNRDLVAMTPDQFKRLHGYDPLNPPISTTGSTTSSTPAGTTTVKSPAVPAKKIKTVGDKLKVAHGCFLIQEFKSGRIRVPATLVKAVGMRPGCKVNFKKLDVNTAKISSPLKVHDDGRISLPRTCIEVDSTSVKKDNLFAYIENGVIKFKLS
jgi:hypothetical protein